MPRPMGPNRGLPETSKDFGGSIKRLFNSLNKWRYLLILSLVLAMICAILALVAPNKLSDLTDTITLGISPNMEVLEEINNSMNKNFSSENITEKTQIIISDPTISNEDKQKFKDRIQAIMTTSSTTKISSLILSLPNSIMKVLLTDIEIDNTIITIDDQIEMLNLTKQMKDTSKTEANLAMMEQLPESVYNLIKPSINIDKVLNIALFMVLLYLTSAIFNYIQSFSLATISNNFARKLRTNISNKINTLPLKYFDTHETGDVLSRITNDVDMIAQNLNQSLATLVTSITLFIGSIIMMFYTNWVMAITAIISSLIGFSIMFLILRKSQK